MRKTRQFRGHSTITWTKFYPILTPSNHARRHVRIYPGDTLGRGLLQKVHRTKAPRHGTHTHLKSQDITRHLTVHTCTIEGTQDSDHHVAHRTKWRTSTWSEPRRCERRSRQGRSCSWARCTWTRCMRWPSSPRRTAWPAAWSSASDSPSPRTTPSRPLGAPPSGMLASHWLIPSILASHWSTFSILASHWSTLSKFIGQL